jgi:hypothetical protein
LGENLCNRDAFRDHRETAPIMTLSRLPLKASLSLHIDTAHYWGMKNFTGCEQEILRVTRPKAFIDERRAWDGGARRLGLHNSKPAPELNWSSCRQSWRAYRHNK